MPVPPVTPPPVPADAREIVLFGGTFDPPTLAHAALPRLARDRLAPGAFLLYVPAARSPHKADAPGAGDGDRIDMLRAAIADVPRAGVWTDEIDRGPPSYTIDTLERLRRAVPPHVRLHLLIGADQAAAFHAWRRPRDILAIAAPIVVPRSPLVTREAFRRALLATGAWAPAELAAWEKAFADAPTIDASATVARALLARRPRDRAALSAMLSPRVLDHIESRCLYA